MTPSPVLVAYDGRCSSTLQAAATLARVLHLDITLATADRRFDRAEATVEDGAAELAGIHVDRVVLPTKHVEKALRELAIERDATAIVTGPDLHGDTTRHLAADAPCPVLVAPEDPRLVADAYRDIGVAYDASVGSRFALTAAADLAIRADARVHIVSVYVDPPHAEATELAAQEAAAGLDRVETVIDVRYGDIGHELREACRHLDVLICGSHGHGRMLRSLIGSVSGELLELPNCPVLLVPPGVKRRGGTALGLSTGAAS